MAGIGELSVSITAKTKKALANVNAFRKSVRSVATSTLKAAASMKTLATAAAGLAGVGATGYLIKRSFDNIDGLAKTSDRIGITTEKLAGLRFAAEESGVGAATLDMSLQRMVRRVSEAARGSGEAVGALNELGISAMRLNALSPDEQFSAIAEAMSRVENQSDRVRLAMKLFDSEGVALLNTLKLGTHGLANYQQEAKNLGLAIDRVDAAQIEAANDAFGRIGKVITGITNKIAIGLAPVVTAVSRKFVAMAPDSETVSKAVNKAMGFVIKTFGYVLDKIEMFRRGLMGLGATATDAAASITASFKSVADAIAKSGIPKIADHAKVGSAHLFVMSENMRRSAAEQRHALEQMMSQPLPSASIDAWWRKTQQDTEKARKELSEQERQKLIERNWNGLRARATGVLGSLQSQASAMFGGVAIVARKGLGAAVDSAMTNLSDQTMQLKDRIGPGILDARSAEGFKQLRSSVNAKNGTDKLLKAEEKGNTLAEKTVTVLGEIKTLIGNTKVLGF